MRERSGGNHVLLDQDSVRALHFHDQPTTMYQSGRYKYDGTESTIPSHITSPRAPPPLFPGRKFHLCPTISPPPPETPPLPVENRGKGGKMPGASPHSHAASGWGNSKMGTLSRWHLASLAGSPPLSIFEPAPFTPNPTGGQPTHQSMCGGFPTQ